jgi:hypothetical protein
MPGLAVTQPFILTGSAPDSRIGSFVSSAGDVNGDGIDDFIVGGGGSGQQGGAYVIYGQVGGIGSINFSALAPSQGFQILGEYAANAGPYMVGTSAGDINGDGYDDIVIGAPYYGPFIPFTGRAYVVYSHATSGTVDLGNMTATQGMILQSPSPLLATSTVMATMMYSSGRPLRGRVARTPVAPFFCSDRPPGSLPRI